MFRALSQYRLYIVLLGLILVPVLAIDASRREPRDFRIYDKIILAVTLPVQLSMDWFMNTVVKTGVEVSSLWKLKDQNTLLVDENRKLVNTIVNIREIEQENARLRSLLKFKETFRMETIVGRVIARDSASEFRSIRIDRGREHGVEKNMAVIHAEGVVGRVVRVENDYSDVITVLDPLSAVDAYVLRSRARGIVEGLNESHCQLKFALRTDDIQPGDVLLSSGLGGSFPKGVPVGTVFKVVRKSYGITQTVEVKPGVNFSRIEEVMVVKSSGTAPIHMEQAGTP